MSLIIPSDNHLFMWDVGQVELKVTQDVNAKFVSANGYWAYRVGSDFPPNGLAGGIAVSLNATTMIPVTYNKTYEIQATLVSGNGLVVQPPVTKEVTIHILDKDQDKDWVPDVSDAFPLDPNRTTADLTIVSPNEGSSFIWDQGSLEIVVTQNIAQDFEGRWQYRVNSVFPETGNAGGVSVEFGVTPSFEVTSNLWATQDYTLQVAIVNKDNTLYEPRVVKEVAFKVNQVDEDYDTVPNVYDAFPYNDKRVTPHITITEPTSNFTFRWDTTDVELKVTQDIAESFEGHWNYKVNSPFSSSGLMDGISVTF